MELPSGANGKKFHSCLITARDCTHATVCLQHGITLSGINILKSLYISYVFRAATPFCFLVTPSGVLLCEVDSIDRQDKVQSVLCRSLPYSAAVNMFHKYCQII
jgi:hypothetical protein